MRKDRAGRDLHNYTAILMALVLVQDVAWLCLAKITGWSDVVQDEFLDHYVVYTYLCSANLLVVFIYWDKLDINLILHPSGLG